MYVPGCDERKIAKIPQIGADCICLDCEDGVAVNMKDASRKGIRELLDTQKVDFGVSECSVRVNSVDSGLCKDDVLEVLGGANMPSAIHLPKVAGREELAFLSACIREAVKKPLDRKLGLIMFIESARSLLDIDSICKAAWEISEAGADFIPEALVFGSDDFAADIGATRTKENTELLLARQQVVVAANLRLHISINDHSYERCQPTRFHAPTAQNSLLKFLFSKSTNASTPTRNPSSVSTVDNVLVLRAH